MMQINTKRCLSLILALVLTFSLLPVSALAEEEETQSSVTETTLPVEVTVAPTEATEDTIPAVAIEETAPMISVEESTAFQAVQGQIDTILDKYDISKSMSEQEIYAAVDAMDGDTFDDAYYDLYLLSNSDELLLLCDEESKMLEENNSSMIIFANSILDIINEYPISLYAESPIDGVSVAATTNRTYSGATVKKDGNMVTITLGNYSLAVTGTITITNTSGADKLLSFSYSASGHNSFSEAQAEGTYSKYELAAGGTITMTLTAARKTTATLELKDFLLEDKVDNADITLSYNALGSVTVAGTTVASGESATVTASGTTFVATPASGASFLGWITNGGKLLSTDASYDLIPTGNMSMEAVFVNSSSVPYFQVETAYLFNNLTDAINCATNNSYTKITSVNNGTLAAGTYTIPSGVTLLIPYDDAKTLHTASPGIVEDSYTKPTTAYHYRTLTMADGAKIIVNGAMSLSACHSTKQGYSGHPTGYVSVVKMNTGSSITVNNGGKLYVWGYITGTGSVTVKSGGCVYEDFQVADWRGGTASLGMLDNDYEVFPMSQYYVQNVEVPMTLEAGAQEYGSMSVSLTGYGLKTLSVPFIGPDAMFRIVSGSITKDYSEENDRLLVDIDGNLSISDMYIYITTIDMLIYQQEIAIDSTKYVLPVTNNMTVNINSGTTTVDQDLAILPGAEIILAKGANFNLASETNLYVYDADEWNTKSYVYSARDFSPVKYAPGQKHTRTADDLVDAKIEINGTADLSAGYAYSTSGGGNICSTGTGTVKVSAAGEATETYQATQSGTDITYATISITPAQLKHEDGEYLETASADDVTTYNYDHHNCEHGDSATHGIWFNGDHKITTKSADPTQTEAGYTTSTCACTHGYTEVLYAAEVNGSQYESLDEAFTAVTSDGTVKLLNNIGGDVTVSKAMTIDKNGKTISLTVGEDYSSKENNDIITIWQLIKIYGTSVTAGDSLDIYFYVTDLEGNDYKAKIDRMKGDSAEPTVYIEAVNWETKYGMRCFSYQDIAAKEMTDTVTVTILDSDDNQISHPFTETIEDYAIRTMDYSGNEGKTNLQTALVDMLNYGTAAQNHWSYRTDDLANAQLTDEQKASASSTVYKNHTVKTDNYPNDGYELAGATLTAESNLLFTFYFSGIDDTNKDQFSADITFMGTTTTISGADFVPYDSTAENKLYGARLTGLAIADGKKSIVCSLKQNGTEIINVTSSVESYIAATLADETKTETLRALCLELKDFIESARTYFSNPNE